MKSLTSPLVLRPDDAIDLQMHTIYSDGTWLPEQLMDYIVSEQFGLVAITDHDRVDTATALQQLAAEKQLPLLTAVEMSTSWRDMPTDVLCYGFDPEQNELQSLTQDIMRRQREKTNSEGKSPLMASRSIILTTRQNRLACIWNTLRSISY